MALEVPLSEAETAVLLDAFDESGDGEVDHAEFVRRLHSAMPVQVAGQPTSSVQFAARQATHAPAAHTESRHGGMTTERSSAKHAQYRRAFTMYDSQHGGGVNARQLKRAMLALGEDATDEASTQTAVASWNSAPSPLSHAFLTAAELARALCIACINASDLLALAATSL